MSKEYHNLKYWYLLRDYRTGLNFETLYHLSCNSDIHGGFGSILNTPYEDYREFEYDSNLITTCHSLDDCLISYYQKFTNDVGMVYSLKNTPFMIRIFSEDMLAEILKILLYEQNDIKSSASSKS